MIPVQVHGVAVMPPANTPVLLLREATGGRRWLPISIGAPEANALVDAHEGVEHVRPDSIELIGQVIEALSHRVERVQVTALRDGVFISELILSEGVHVSARPSDAIAIGMRAGVPVEVHEAVLDEASVEVEIAESAGPAAFGAGEPGPEQEQEIASFRARLDELTVEDFDDRPPE